MGGHFPLWPDVHVAIGVIRVTTVTDQLTLPLSPPVPTTQVAALLGAEYGPEDVAEVQLKPAAELNEMLEAMS